MRKKPDPMRMRVVRRFNQRDFYRRGFRSKKTDMNELKSKIQREPSFVRTVKVKGGYLVYSAPKRSR